MGIDAFGNELKEFWPDVHHYLQRRHARQLQKKEEKQLTLVHTEFTLTLASALPACIQTPVEQSKLGKFGRKCSEK